MKWKSEVKHTTPATCAHITLRSNGLGNEVKLIDLHKHRKPSSSYIKLFGNVIVHSTKHLQTASRLSDEEERDVCHTSNSRVLILLHFCYFSASNQLFTPRVTLAERFKEAQLNNCEEEWGADGGFNPRNKTQPHTLSYPGLILRFFIRWILL